MCVACKNITQWLCQPSGRSHLMMIPAPFLKENGLLQYWHSWGETCFCSCFICKICSLLENFPQQHTWLQRWAETRSSSVVWHVSSDVLHCCPVASPGGQLVSLTLLSQSSPKCDSPAIGSWLEAGEEDGRSLVMKKLFPQPASLEGEESSHSTAFPGRLDWVFPPCDSSENSGEGGLLHSATDGQNEIFRCS